MAKQKREELGVQNGDRIIIKGSVSFARIDKLIDGEALEKENKRRAGLGMNPMKPFRSITIENPEVVQGQNTPLATFHGQSVYTDQKTGVPKLTVDSKSKFPPAYGHFQEDGTLKEIPDPQRNPAVGQVVYLWIEAYSSKGFPNMGSSFNAIVFEKGDIKYYETGGGLAGFGQALGVSVQSMPSQPQAQPEPQVVNGNFGGLAPAPHQPQTNPAAQNTGGFGGLGGQTQAAPQPAVGNFGQAPAANSFGVQDADLAGGGSSFAAAGGSPFGGSFGGGDSSGQRANSPFA